MIGATGRTWREMGAITLDGVTYAKGLGAHAASEVRYILGGTYSAFLADVGVDDEVGSNGRVEFQVWADGVQLFDSGLVTGSDRQHRHTRHYRRCDRQERAEAGRDRRC